MSRPSVDSSVSSIPTIEDLHNLTSRILAATNGAIKNLSENIPAIELPNILSSSSGSDISAAAASSANAAHEVLATASNTAASVRDKLGLSADSSPLKAMVAQDHNQVLVFRPHADKGSSSSSITDLIKLHYQLSADWVKDNTTTIALGALALGAAVVVGTVAVNAASAHRHKMRRQRVVKTKNGGKREVVVITNIATLEGAAIALSLDQEGFVVFVGVPNQLRADEVKKWAHIDIHPIVVDCSKTDSVEELVRAVTNFLDQHNGVLLGEISATSSSSVILEEELTSSTANIHVLSPEHAIKAVSDAEARYRHHDKTDRSLFRLAAVVVSPSSSALGPVEKVNLELWRQAIDTNITGAVVVSQKFMPLLRRTLALGARRSPRLIFVSSAITGSIGFPYESAICASHHAIDSIADSVRREIKPHGIDVVCLRPGFTDRSFRKEWGAKSIKSNAGVLGLFNTMDAARIIGASFISTSTTGDLCDATYDAITALRPATHVRVGKSSDSYAFVGWAAPRYAVDRYLKTKPIRIFSLPSSANSPAKILFNPTIPPFSESPHSIFAGLNSFAPIMKKMFEKLKHHGAEHDDAAEKAAAAAAIAAEKKAERERGPRMHPELLELYTVTDHVLGVGTFATVKEIVLKETGKSYALKIILKKTLQGKSAMLDTEISVLSKVRHPNCVSLLELFETEDAVYLVTDLAQGGELFDQLLKKGFYGESDAARLVHQILMGVEYLHTMGVVHRDLKPENLLFKDKSENSRLMITDFGLSKVLTGGNDVLMTACGTPGYVAPEVLEQIGHGKPVDMWSVGVIAYTLLCGYTPFWGEDQPSLFESIMSGEYEYEQEYWKDISQLAKSFIDTLLVPAEQRPTATHALSHPWFRAMLEQDMETPVSPAESINLLPGMRKNFNARSAFKKAVRAVGLIRKMQSGSPPNTSFASGEEPDVVIGGNSSRPTSNLSFHDVVSAAVMSRKGLNLHSTPEDESEDVESVNAVLENLTIKNP
ncbi:hypothetical protein BGZ99_007964 [Dissophora globulifera]|uniref:Protein kinase domain-containing protein n=1 Tax=Dissophora globulifera TaxID=979702 RepID=A0A9P6RBZ7_9FUNG|nr:hypothetical protein BGZ99_007964 [Dissophora globulifera]